MPSALAPKPSGQPGIDNAASPGSGGVDVLFERIAAQYDDLSRQLKLIARYVELHRDHLGLEKIQDVAERCGVHPSAVVRFAKQFGFSGWSELQKMFRENLSAQLTPNHSYQARIRDVIDQAQDGLSNTEIAGQFIGGAVAGMRGLQHGLSNGALDAAIELLVQAPSIWVAGARRSFPAASYLSYALHHANRPIHLVSGLGAMQECQLRGMQSGDVLIAISHAPYAQETMQAVEAARAGGVRSVAITDSRMSPLALAADVTLLVSESSTFGFRSLTNTMVLAQSLFIALAYRLEVEARTRGRP
jgi:DNA-binding MurR/RpiR family transcriptional regulator